jgi:L-threonylcarbamoyladenylate synthase
VLGIPVIAGAAKAKASAPQVAPGLLKRHYSPNTPVVLHAELGGQPWRNAPADEAWLLVAKPAGRCPKNIFWLDARGDLRGAARRLFGMLRQLDGAGFSKIHAETARGTGPADAINDRLRRAAEK